MLAVSSSVPNHGNLLPYDLRYSRSRRPLFSAGPFTKVMVLIRAFVSMVELMSTMRFTRLWPCGERG